MRATRYSVRPTISIWMWKLLLIPNSAMIRRSRILTFKKRSRKAGVVTRKARRTSIFIEVLLPPTLLGRRQRVNGDVCVVGGAQAVDPGLAQRERLCRATVGRIKTPFEP